MSLLMARLRRNSGNLSQSAEMVNNGLIGENDKTYR